MRKVFLLLVAIGLLVLAGCGTTHTRTIVKPPPSPPAQPQTRGGRVHLEPNFGQVPPGLRLALPLKGFAGIPGYDAVTLSNVPSSAAAVGCYANGSFANCGEAHSRFPNAHLVSIATNAGVVAKCLDTEPGDATPSQDPGWVRGMISRGIYRPCIYASASDMGSVQAFMANIPRSSYLLWVAAWNGDSSIPGGFDAHQWFSNCCIDRDTFASYFFNAPAPPDLHLYSRFPNLVFTNGRHNAWCSRGCNERGVVKSYDFHRAHPIKYKTSLFKDEQRLQWLDWRLGYLIHHRSVKVNGDNFVYGREHEIYNRAYRHLVCKTWARCDF